MLANVTPLLGVDTEALELRCSLDPADPHVPGDEIQLQQVLVNLIRNAFEASRGQAEPIIVDLGSRCQGRDWVEVSVCDHGHGIPAEIADQIFDPFITGRSDGLGLGLSISQSIVDAHGGELHVHARQGGGTCFTMLLPRVQEKA